MPEIKIKFDKTIKRPGKLIVIQGDNYFAIPSSIAFSFIEDDPYPDLLNEEDLVAIRQAREQEVVAIPEPGEDEDDLASAMEEAGIKLTAPDIEAPFRAGDDCTEEGSMLSEKQIGVINRVSQLYHNDPSGKNIRMMDQVVRVGTSFTVPSLIRVKNRLHPTYLQAVVAAFMRAGPKPAHGADYMGAAYAALLPGEDHPDYLKPEELGQDLTAPPVQVIDHTAEKNATLAAASKSRSADVSGILSRIQAEIGE